LTVVVVLVDAGETVEAVVVDEEGAVESGGAMVGGGGVTLDEAGVVSGGVRGELVSAAGVPAQAAVTNKMVSASRENRIAPLLDLNHPPDN
jgi:hypothetical protein